MILLVKRSGKYFAIGAPKDPPLMLCLKLQYLNEICKKGEWERKKESELIITGVRPEDERALASKSRCR